MVSRHSAPLLIGLEGPPVVLERLVLGQSEVDGGRREAFVQNLVHDHPELIPMAEIEPAFMPLISVCRELPTPAGYLDNLWMTPAGGIVLGECKLTRNPQARREVIAQGLDYARAVNSWGYEDLEAAIKKALNDKEASLWNLVGAQGDLNESQFADAVQRRLKLGRFLILIIGDGIQEGVEALTSFLQLHAGLHVGLALVDLSIWKGAGDGLIVVPRVPMRTVVIERGVVITDPLSGVRIEPAGLAPTPSRTITERPITASEPEFFDQLDAHRPGLSERLRAFLRIVAELAVEPEFRRTMLLRSQVSNDAALTLATVDVSGKVWFGSAWNSANKVGHSSAAVKYLEALAGLVGGQIRSYKTSTPPEVLSAEGKALDLMQLLSLADQWVFLITDFIAEVSQ